MSGKEHRGAEATIKILESFSSCMDVGPKVGKKRKWILMYLEENMDNNVPSARTVSSILNQLKKDGYLRKRKDNVYRWYPTNELKKLGAGDISKTY